MCFQKGWRKHMCNPGDSGLSDPGDSGLVWSRWQLRMAWSDPADGGLSDPGDSVACLVQVSS